MSLHQGRHTWLEIKKFGDEEMFMLLFASLRLQKRIQVFLVSPLHLFIFHSTSCTSHCMWLGTNRACPIDQSPHTCVNHDHFNLFTVISIQQSYRMRKNQVLLSMVPIFRPFARSVSAYIPTTRAKMAPHLLGDNINSRHNLPHHIKTS